MKIFSINLHHHMEVDFYRKLERICDLIAQNDYDIVFFQEVGQFKMMPIVKNDLKQGNFLLIIEQILLLKYNIKYNSYVDMFKESYECAYEEGLGILFKGDIEVNSYYVSNSKSSDNWETRKAMKIKVGQYSIYSVHLGWDTESELFKDQLKNMNIDNNEVNIVLGDLNCEYGTTNYAMIHNYGLVNATEIISPELLDNFTCKNNTGEKIDYVLTNSIENIKTVKHHFTDFSVSDHIGFEVEVD